MLFKMKIGPLYGRVIEMKYSDGMAMVAAGQAERTDYVGKPAIAAAAAMAHGSAPLPVEKQARFSNRKSKPENRKS